MKKIVVTLLLLTTPGIALAQTPPLVSGPPETVYSEAQRARDEDLSRRLAQSLLRPSYSLEGQFTRWKTPVCPRVVGLEPTAAFVVERRIRDIATQVGAPVDRTDPCKPNIIVLVSPDPQDTLDEVVKADFMLVAGARSKDRMVIRHPVQAWYFGLYRDYKGRTFWDMDWEFYLDAPPRAAGRMTRLTTGIKAQIGVATIIVDAAAISGLTLGSLGDYLSMMALAQTPATGRCQPAPSIANLFVKDCGAEVQAASLSDVDLAMLTSLYKAEEEPEKLQMNRLHLGMTQYLEGAFGK